MDLGDLFVLDKPGMRSGISNTPAAPQGSCRGVCHVRLLDATRGSPHCSRDPPLDHKHFRIAVVKGLVQKIRAEHDATMAAKPLAERKRVAKRAKHAAQRKVAKAQSVCDEAMERFVQLEYEEEQAASSAGTVVAGTTVGSSSSSTAATAATAAAASESGTTVSPSKRRGSSGKGLGKRPAARISNHLAALPPRKVETQCGVCRALGKPYRGGTAKPRVAKLVCPHEDCYDGYCSLECWNLWHHKKEK